MAASARYSSSKHPTATNKYDDDDEDDDLDALREAALMTLNSKKRKRSSDRSPDRRRPRRRSRQSLSRSSSRSYSSSSSSRSSRSYSSTSRSSHLSTISSHSLDAHDKDYRFESKDKPITGDIDERFPQDIAHDNDMLIVDCPLQDDDLLLNEERPPPITVAKPKTEKKPSDRDERSRHKPVVKEVSRRKEEPKKKSSSHDRPAPTTVKPDSKEFDLRQLIKKGRTEETHSSDTARTDQKRTVQIRSNGNQLTVHKNIQSRSSSSSKTREH